MMFSNLSKLIAEFVGTGILACVVIGSGIMGDRLSSDDGISLIINAFSPVSALIVLILVLGPISGAHFNPVVSLVNLVAKTQKLGKTIAYVIAQISGAILGAIIGNVMFETPAIDFSSNYRVSPAHFLGEVIATAGLIAVIGILAAHKQEKFIVYFIRQPSFDNRSVVLGYLCRH
jgi:glycerol uptake facilitator-like aquaporin